MYCNWCGNQLSADQMACPRCGIATSYHTSTPSAAIAGEGDSPQEATLPSYSFGPIMEFSIGGTDIQTQEPARNTPYQTGSLVAPQSASGYAQPFPAQAGQAVISSTAGTGRHELSRRMIILLVAVAVCVIFSGIGLIYYAAIFQPAKLRAQATATAQAIAKAEARASATAYAHSPQGIFAQATRETPLISDSLANNNSGFWFTLNRSDGGCAFSRDAYHIRVSAYAHSFWCSSSGGEYTGFAFQVKMTLLAGYSGGIMFHRLGPSLNAYLFTLHNDGSYALRILQNDNSNILLASNRSSAIIAGLNHTNLLTVIMRGSNIYLYANKQFLTMVSDSTLTIGYFALYASTDAYTNSADAAFTNETVWE